MTKQELHNFAMFVREYDDINIPTNVVNMRHEVKVDKLNFREAIDAYIKQHKLITPLKLKR